MNPFVVGCTLVGPDTQANSSLYLQSDFWDLTNGYERETKQEGMGEGNI